MIDVQLQPFGRTLMTAALAALKYNAVVKTKNQENFKKELENIEKSRQDTELLEGVSFDLTSRIIDKRFTTSKVFVKSGGLQRPSTFNFKKTTTESDKHLRNVVEKTTLKANSTYNKAVTRHNKTLNDKKIKASFKLINLKPVFK